MLVIVDTTVWIDYLRGTWNAETVWLEQQLGRTALALTDLILSEILQGVRNKRQFQDTRKDLSRYDIFNSCGSELAIASARNYLMLREKGFTVRKTIDCLIATFCIRNGHSLLHRDRDFDAFEQHLGLKVIHPARQ